MYVLPFWRKAKSLSPIGIFRVEAEDKVFVLLKDWFNAQYFKYQQSRKPKYEINLLKPNGYLMHQQF
jgi:hypothetical protein